MSLFLKFIIFGFEIRKWEGGEDASGDDQRNEKALRIIWKSFAVCYSA